MAEYHVFLIGGTDDESAVATAIQDDRRCHLSFAYRGKTIVAESTDFFETLCQIRLQLEEDGLIPFCYGASMTVYPSGMARDMGLGLKAYKLVIGKHSRREDLVGIFSEGPDIIPCSVKIQREFYEEWLESDKT